MKATPPTAANPAAVVDLDEIRDAIELLIEPGDLVELRAPISKNRVVSGYYKNDPEGVDALLCDAQKLSSRPNLKDQPDSIYITLNQIDPLLHPRAFNHIKDYAKFSTQDDNVFWRRRLLIDVDATRPAGVSSTNAQHTEALRVAGLIADFLEEQGIRCIRADSGNGGHVLVTLDLENTAESTALLERVLKALAYRFDNETVHVDTTTYNASRICKLYGSVAGKGDSTPDQPHRLAKILHVPDDLTPASVEQLQVIAGMLPDEIRPTAKQSRPSGSSRFDITRWIADHLPDAHEPVSYRGGLKWVLEECPFNSDHKAPDAAVFESAAGVLGFKCLHNSCAGKDWHALRALREPDRNGHNYPPHQADSAPYAQAKTVPDSENGSEDFSPFSPISRNKGQDKGWPAPLADEAYYGILGRIIRLIEPETEADPAALMISLQAAIGNLIGPGPHGMVGETPHPLKISGVIVGETGDARKGMSWDPIRKILLIVDAIWTMERIFRSMVSGEGLIWEVRDARYAERPSKDPVTKRQTGETYTEMEDPGIADKRLFVMVSEFAGPLKVASRDGSTLFDVVRDSYDCDYFQIPTKNNPAKASGVHMSFLGHITPSDLKKYLSETDIGNGFSNRFWWICARRSRYLPEGGNLPNLNGVASQLSEAVQKARKLKTVTRDKAARYVWKVIYRRLSTPPPGVFGQVVARAAPNVLRLSVLYAVLDGSAEVRIPHLFAALACWDYAEESARIIFGDSTGDHVADRILHELRRSDEGLTRTQVGDLFGGAKKDGYRIAAALELLEKHGLVSRERHETGGRPVERWHSTRGTVAAPVRRHLASAQAALEEYNSTLTSGNGEKGGKAAANRPDESLVSTSACDEPPELEF